MKIKKIFRAMLIAVFCVCVTGAPLSYSQQAAQQMPQIDVSPDQMQKMETMMHEMQHFYESLSPEDKAAFEGELAAEVEKEQKKLESMDPSQQKEYVETAFRAFDDIDLDELLSQIEEEEAEENQDNSETLGATQDKQKKKEAQEEEEQKKKKIKETLDIINSIIKIINSLTEKLSGVKPSPQDLIEKWIDKKYIQRWAGSKSNWNTFKTELDEMIQKLHILKETDPKTGKYYYLDNIKEVEKLYGQLDMLHNTIKKYEPNIELSDEGKIENEASKSALRRLINYLVDTTNTITKSAQEIISAFEKKEAPRIKKEEEAKAKKAARKKRKSKGRIREAGTPERPDYEPDYGYGDDSGYYSPESGYSDSGYDSGYDSGDYPDYSAPSYTPSYTPSSDEKKKDTTTSGDKGKGVTGKKDDKVTPSDDKKKQPGIKAKKEEPDYTSELKKKYRKEYKQLEKVESNLSNFEDSFDELQDMDNWKKLEAYLKTADKDEALMEKVKQASGYLDKALTNAKKFAKQVKDNVKESKLKKAFYNKTQKIRDEYDSIIKDLNKKLGRVRTIYDINLVHNAKKIDVTNETGEPCLYNLKKLNAVFNELKTKSGKK
ncbi:hypothetical protein ACFLYU_01415 [Candidatus Dependentiae bacterium]